MSYLLIVLARKEFVAKIQPFQTACVTQTITNVLVNSYVEKYKKVEIYPELVDQDWEIQNSHVRTYEAGNVKFA